jgi:diketogulonate reductase-like aldo/keto reductase
VPAGANETDATPGQATIAWAPGNRVLPIIGSESAQLADDRGVAQLVLTAQQVARLDAASAAPALEADVDPQARGDAVIVRPGGIAAAVVGVLDHAVDR